jgi:SAM-dependent methyltransferase
MNIASVVDQPREGDFNYSQRIPVKGWVYAGYRHDRIARISVHAPNGEIGATTQLYARTDVALAHQLPPDTRTGFRLIATYLPSGPTPAVLGIEVRVEFTDGSVTPLAGIHIQLLANDHTTAPLGQLCNPRHTAVLHRNQIYSSSTTNAAPNSECIDLIAETLPPGISLIEVGCGSGSYCEPLRARGFSWIGCEASLDHAHQLALHSRPHRIIEKSIWPRSRFRLPAADREFDAAISIGMLERVPDLDPVLAEISRATKRHALFSVSNMEVVPFLANRSVVPWHLLDPERVNFFNRFNLRALLQPHFPTVEVLDYSPLSLASPDGLPLPDRLLAVCEK